MSCKQLWRRLDLSFLPRIFVMAFHGASCANELESQAQAVASTGRQGGLVFNCSAEKLPALADALHRYFRSLGVGDDLYSESFDDGYETLQLTLRDSSGGTAR